MYFANAMALATQNVHASEVLFASAVMTFGTFVAPSASGEGVRELVFVWLLGSKAGAAKAFLIGNLGFWIEKIPLSVPGGLLLLFRRDPTLPALTTPAAWEARAASCAPKRVGRRGPARTGCGATGERSARPVHGGLDAAGPGPPTSSRGGSVASG